MTEIERIFHRVFAGIVSTTKLSLLGELLPEISSLIPLETLYIDNWCIWMAKRKTTVNCDNVEKSCIRSIFMVFPAETPGSIY